MLMLNSSSKKKKSSNNVSAICGLPTFHSYKKERCSTRQTIHVSPQDSLPEESKINRHGHDAAKPQAAEWSKDRIYTARELPSPSHKDGFKGDMKTHTRDKLTYCLASPITSPITNVNTLDECMNFKQLQIDIDECDLKGDPLSALLNGSHSPLAKLEDAQKLAWLKSQLIGENQEFVTPFGKLHLVYADHTASGRSLYFIEDFITRHILPFYGNTHIDDSYVGGRTSKMMRQAEEYIKEKLGGSKDDALIMCGWGCTAAIKWLQEVIGITVPSNLRACILDIMQVVYEERWLVFTGPYEHHSNLLSWRQILAEVIEIPANEEGEIDMGKLEAALLDAEESGRRQKIGVFSACNNVTDMLSDTCAIARLLHKHGAFACFDFAAGTRCTMKG